MTNQVYEDSGLTNQAYEDSQGDAGPLRVPGPTLETRVVTVLGPQLPQEPSCARARHHNNMDLTLQDQHVVARVKWEQNMDSNRK